MDKDMHRLKGLEKSFPCKWEPKRAGVMILISDKIGFKTKTVQRDKEGHYIVVKGSIDQEDITLINIYAPNTGAPKYVKERLLDLKGEIDCNTLIAGDLNITLSPYLFFFLDDLSQGDSAVLMSPTSVLQSISHFRSNSLSFTYLGAPVLGT